MTRAAADSGVFPVWPVAMAGIAGAAMFNLAPAFLASNAAWFGLDDRQIGWLMSAEIAGIAIASVLTLLFGHRGQLRTLALIGLGVIVVGNLASLAAQTFSSYLVIRFLIGLFGDGFAYVTAVSTLGRHKNPTRAFATLSFSNMCFSGTALLALSQSPESHTRLAVVVLFALLSASAIAAWRRWPQFLDSGAESGSFQLRPLHILGLIGLFAFTANLGAVWGYAERLAEGTGLSSGEITALLSVSIVFQALGSLLAMFCSRYRRPDRILVIVAGLQIAGLWLLSGATGPWLYIGGLALWGGSWNLGIANLLGMLSMTRGGPRSLSLAPGVEAMGAASGPLLVVALIPFGTQAAVPLVGILGALTAIILALPMARLVLPRGRL